MNPESRPTGAKGPAVYALTRDAAVLGRMLARELDGTLHIPSRLRPLAPEAETFDALGAAVDALFHARAAHVFICAAGVAVRLIAPLLRGKDQDPAVVVLDQRGEHCVSLLSGHLGGANALARRVANLTKGRAVITTATDSAGAPAMEILARDAGLAVGTPHCVKKVNLALAEGRSVAFWDPDGSLGLAAMPEHFHAAEAPEQAAVVVDYHAPRNQEILYLHPRCLCLGVGCRKDVPASDILERVQALFARHNLALAGLCGLGTAEAKREEAGLREAARELGLEPRYFSAERLDAVPVPTPSLAPYKALGTHSVCEAAALLLSQGGYLLVKKHADRTVTLAVALMRGARERRA